MDPEVGVPGVLLPGSEVEGGMGATALKNVLSVTTYGTKVVFHVIVGVKV